MAKKRVEKIVKLLNKICLYGCKGRAAGGGYELCA